MCICLLSMYVCLCMYCVEWVYMNACFCVCTFVHVLSLVSFTHMVSLAESEGNGFVQGNDWGFKKFMRRGQCEDCTAR